MVPTKIVHVSDLRGNARTIGEQRRKEKDNVFGKGSRTPVAVAILVKNPASTKQGGHPAICESTR